MAMVDMKDLYMQIVLIKIYFVRILINYSNLPFSSWQSIVPEQYCLQNGDKTCRRW
jgi:hypothetical protein